MKLFDLQGNNTNFITEILAGFTSFFTMSYLLSVCPAIIGSRGVTTETVYIGMCIACFLGCVIMGIWSKQPFVVAPSIGMTVYFSSTLMTDMSFTYHEALLIMSVSGIFFIILSFAGIGNSVFNTVSGSMKNGISAGIGLYIAMVGLQNAGVLVKDDKTIIWKIGELSYRKTDVFPIIVLFVGLIVIGICKRIGMPSPPFFGIAVSCLLVFTGGHIPQLRDLLSIRIQMGEFNPNFRTWYDEGLLKNITRGILSLIKRPDMTLKAALMLLITTIVIAVFNMTDSVGVTYAIAKNHGKFDDNGNFGAFKNTLAASSVSSFAGTMFGCPTLSIAPESVAGICAQGKSGLTSVTAGLLFLLAALFVPVANYIPPALTACVMIYIGFTMLGAVKEIDCGDIGEGIPALLTILLIPVTSSIVDGIAFGILFHVLINLCTFKLKAIKPIEIVVAIFFGINYLYF
ncbi:MAG: NCS2 family permease [Clostridia bacterium]|nr:NCS2 family permease [Clostridia bacterium]